MTSNQIPEKQQKSSKKWFALPVLAAMLAAGAGAGALSYATLSSAATAPSQTSITGHSGAGKTHAPRVKPAAIGKVVSVSGTTITLTGNDAKTYTIDASSAKVLKFTAPATPPAAPAPGTKPVRPTPATITVADIQPGDTLLVQGTANGTSVTATTIVDGVLAKGWRGGGAGMGGRSFGGPRLGGTVTAVNGTIVTVSQTQKDGTVKTYTIDTSSAKIHKTVDISTSDIQVGDNLNVRGTLSGTSVSATDIMDGLMMPPKAPAAN